MIENAAEAANSVQLQLNGLIVHFNLERITKLRQPDSKEPLNAYYPFRERRLAAEKVVAPKPPNEE